MFSAKRKEHVPSPSRGLRESDPSSSSSSTSSKGSLRDPDPYSPLLRRNNLLSPEATATIHQELEEERTQVSEDKLSSTAHRPHTKRDDKTLFYLTICMSAFAVVLVMIWLINNAILVWGSLIAVAFCFAVYHTALARAHFFREFLMEYQYASEKAYHRNQSSEDFTNAILKKIWSGLAQAIANYEIPALQAVLDSNLPVTLRNKQVSLKIVSWNVGTIAPVVPSMTVIRTVGPRSILLELTANLATDEMVMLMDVSVGFGAASMHFPVKISNFLFSAPMRMEAILSPLTGMHEWVASFSLLAEPQIDMEVTAMNMPFDAMIFPGIKNYIKFVVAKVVNAESFMYPKLLSITLAGEYLANYSPAAEKQFHQGLPITDLALIPIDSEAPEGWTVISKPFIFGPSAILYFNTPSSLTNSIESENGETERKRSRGRQLADMGKKAIDAPTKLVGTLRHKHSSDKEREKEKEREREREREKDKEKEGEQSGRTSSPRTSTDEHSLLSEFLSSNSNRDSGGQVLPPPMYICYKQDKNGEPITDVNIIYEVQGEKLPKGWLLADTLNSPSSSSTPSTDQEDPQTEDSSPSSNPSSSSASHSISSFSSNSTPSSAASSPSLERRCAAVVAKHPIPSLCYTRKKKSIDGSTKPVVTGIIVTPRQKKRLLPSTYTIVKKSATGDFSVRLPSHPTQKRLYLGLRLETNN